MMTEQKIIKTKGGVLEVAKQLGNVTKACNCGAQPRPFLSVVVESTITRAPRRGISKPMGSANGSTG